MAGLCALAACGRSTSSPKSSSAGGTPTETSGGGGNGGTTPVDSGGTDAAGEPGTSTGGSAGEAGEIPVEPCGAFATARVVRVQEHGAIGDGQTDDTEAFAAALAALGGDESVLELEAGAKYVVKSALELSGGTRLRGNGATLLLGDASAGALRVEGADDVAICDLQIDYAELPFTQGKLASWGNEIFVQLDEGFGAPPIGDMEGQFATIRARQRLWRLPVLALDVVGRRVTLSTTAEARLDVGQPESEAPVIIPILGRSQLGGSVITIHDSSDVRLNGVQVLAASSDAIVISANRGAVSLVDVGVLPPADSPRAASAWERGIHVVDNRGAVSLERCHVDQAQGDALDFGATWLEVTAVADGRDIELAPGVGLPQVGDTLEIVDPTGVSLLGDVEVESVASATQLRLASALPGLAAGALVVSQRASNPGSSVIDSTFSGSSVRLRGALTFERSQVRGAPTLISADLPGEGPLPRGMILRDSRFEHALGSVDLRESTSRKSALTRDLTGIVFENDTFVGLVHVSDSFGLRFSGSNFLDPVRKVLLDLGNSREVHVTGLRADGELVEDPISHISLCCDMSAGNITFD